MNHVTTYNGRLLGAKNHTSLYLFFIVSRPIVLFLYMKYFIIYRESVVLPFHLIITLIQIVSHTIFIHYLQEAAVGGGFHGNC